MAEQMRTFSFEGNTLEEMHGWMQGGAGLNGIVPTIQALRGLATDLETSVEGLRRALTDIGVGWEGAAGEGAALAIGDGETWGVESQEPIVTSAHSADGVADGFVSTRGRMPSPAEAQLSAGEHAVARALPILGPLIDQQLSDQRRDQVTNEARRHMNDWQDNAQSSVGAVQPLPPVPQPVVEGAPAQPGAPGQQVVVPATTVVASAVGAPPATSIPTGPGGGGGPGALVQQPPAAGPPGVGAVRPPVGAPPLFGTPTPPTVPVAGGPATIGGAVPPARPAGGAPLMPLPIGGTPGDETAGRRRAYGPGAFNASEIARSRGGAPAGMRGGVLGVASDGATTRPGARAGGVGGVDGGAQGRGGAAAHGAASGRGGSIMQPAVGGGVRGEDDDEHRDQYAVESDEYFVGEPHKVAPPVIGG